MFNYYTWNSFSRNPQQCCGDELVLQPPPIQSVKYIYTSLSSLEAFNQLLLY